MALNQSDKLEDKDRQQSAGDRGGGQGELQLHEWFEQLQARKDLVRISVVRKRQARWSIPCRILGYDRNSELLTVYHVDEKQVYSLKLNEIDDFIVY